MSLKERIRALNRWQKAGLIVLTILVAYTLIGFFVIPPVFKIILSNSLSENLGRKATIQSIDVNPYALSMTIRGVNVRQKDSPATFASFDKLYVNVEAVSVIKRALVVKRVTVVKPYVKLIRTAPHEYNASDLLAGPPVRMPISHFSLNNIELLNGKIVVWDIPKHETHEIDDLTLAIPFISNLPAKVDVWVKPHFSAVVGGSPFSFRGETKPFSPTRETNLNMDFRDVNIPKYLAYVPGKLNFDLRSALLDTNLKFTYEQPSGETPSMKVSGSVVLRKVQAFDDEGKLIMSLPKLQIGIGSFSPLKRRLHLSQIVFHPMQLNVWRNQDGTLNMKHLLGKGERSASPEQKPGGGLSYSLILDKLKLNEAEIQFADFSRTPTFRTTLSPVTLEVDHYSNEKGSKADLLLAANTKAGERIDLKGKFSGSPFSSIGTLEFANIPVKKYAPYYGDKIKFMIEEGSFWFRTDYNLSRGEKGAEMVLSGLSSSLKAVRFRKEGAERPFLEIPSIGIENAAFDWRKRNLTVQTFTSEGGKLNLIRYKDGSLNLMTLMPPSPAKEKGPKQPNPAVAIKPWDVKLVDAKVQKYAISAQDRSAPEPVSLKLDDFTLDMQNLSTVENSQGKISLSFKLNEGGTAAINGSVGVKPAFADLKIKMDNIGIQPAQPYFQQRIKANLTGGALSIDGNLLAGRKSQGEKFGLSYLGALSLDNFSASSQGKEFLRWKTFEVKGIDYGNRPGHATVQELAMDDYYAFVRITPEGTVNVLDLVTPGKSGPEQSSGPESAPNAGGSRPETPSGAAAAGGGKEGSFGTVKIGKAYLKAGKIEFVDQHIKPNFSTDIADLGGSILGMSSEENSEATIDLQGKMNGTAPLEMKGKASPLGKPLRVDMSINLKGLDMMRLSPFARKYVGYTLEKGNLSLDLKYVIVKRKLDSKNEFLLDELTFGKKVQSKDAISLPIKLAVSLLKNRKGQIKLNVPVSGDLNDPKFHIGGIILKAVRSLITKAISSPFSILASIVNWHGEKLSYVEFPYGSADIAKQAGVKLDKLAKALYERPNLSLDVMGYAAPNQDRQALKLDLFKRALKEQKLKEMAKSGQSGVSLSQVQIGQSEFQKYLTMAYQAELAKEQKKQQQESPPSQNVSRSQMENFLMSKINVADEDLRLLAQKRAVKVRQYILNQSKIKPDRIFLVTPNSLAPKEKKGEKESRVDMALK